MKTNIKKLCCTNPDCEHYKKFGYGNIGRHSFYSTRDGRKRRFICITCAKTFSSSKGTVYYRLQKSKNVFDEVVFMSVEGMSQSSIARVKKISRNTVADWLMKASKIAS